MSTAYVNGRFVPFTEAALPLDDPGVVWGAIITDRFRTFRGVLFQVREHIDRFRRSCELARVPLEATTSQLCGAAAELVRRNYSGNDLSVIFLATPGPTLIVHTVPLPVERIERLWLEGATLQIQGGYTGVSTIIKHRSRLAWWIAARAVQESDPTAEPLFIDLAMNSICETPTANLIAVLDGTLATPPWNAVLPGISLKTTSELATRTGLRVVERRIPPQELWTASEVFLTNSTLCIAPVARINEHSFPTSGPILTQLQAEWSRLVGVQIGRPAS